MVRQTVIAWAEDEDRSGAETGLAVVAGESITYTAGDVIEQPSMYPLYAMYYAGTEFDAYPLDYVRFASPNINGKGVNSQYIRRGGVTDKFNSGILDFTTFPMFGTPGQQITAYSLEDDEGGTAHMNYGCIILSDGPIPYGPRPITHILDCTATAALAAGLTWETEVPTINQDIPAGTYIIHGADMVSASGIASRLIIPGVDHRPAFIPRHDVEDPVHPFNMCINPAGYKLVHKGGTVNFTLEHCALTTDTYEHLQLFLQKVG